MIFSLILFIGSLSYIFLYYAYFLFATKHSGRSYGVKTSTTYKPTISLIICAYNEDRIIATKIQNTLKIEYPHDRLEVIVFDNGSEDKTSEIASSFARHGVKVHSLTGKNRGKSAGLNEAFTHAHGEIIAITDADVLLQGDILLRAIPYFADSSVGAVVGSQKLLNPEESTSTRTEESLLQSYRLLRKAESVVDSVVVCSGEFMAFRKNLIRRLDEDVGSDDVQIAVKVRKEGFRVLFLEDAVYLTYAPRRMRARFKQKIRRSAQLIQAFIRYRGVMFDRRYGAYSKLIYPWNFFMHVISPFIFFLLLGTTTSLLILDFWNALKILSAVIVVSAVLVVATKVHSNSRRGGFFSPRVILTFIEAQCILLLGSISLIRRKPFKWKPSQETRRL